MSLLQKASIITTPTAYAEDYLYSIKPAYALGPELVTNGTFDTDSNWNLGTGFSISGGKLNITNANGTAASQSGVMVIGRKYKVQVTATFVSGNRIILPYDGSNPKITINTVGTQTYEYELTPLANSGTLFIFSDGNGNGSIDNVSVKEIIDADFDFDRNSTGTRVNEDYLIEDVPYNLAKYSEDFSDSVYTKFQASIAETTIQSPISGSYVQSISNTNTGTTYSFISQNLSAPDRESNATLSVYAKKGTYNRLGISSRASGNTFGVLFDLDSGTVVDTSSGSAQILGSSVQSAGNDFYLCSVSVEKATQFNIHPVPNNISNAGLLTGSLSYTETGNVNIFGAQAVKGTNLKPYLKTTDRLDIPRIDYTNGEPSILLEPSRTNLISYSNDFTNAAWTKTNATITANQAISPEGIQNADKYSGTTTGQNFFHTISVSDNFAYSFYVKYINAPFIRLRVNSISTWFNIETIEVATNNFNDASIEDVGNGWRKLTVINTTSGSFTTAYIHPHATDNTTLEQDGGEFFFYGAQLEAGSYATSLIHTSGSAVTRSADAANNAGNSDLFNDSEGVLYAEAKVIDTDSANKMITLSNGTNSTRVLIRYVGTTLLAQLRISGSNQYEFAYTPSNITENLKMAIKYKVNDFSFYVNGTQLNSSNSGNVFSSGTLTELAFDDGGGSNIFNGNVKSVMVFKEALTDLELEKLTGYNNHELYMNYYNRLSYLGLVEEYNVESDINNYIL